MPLRPDDRTALVDGLLARVGELFLDSDHPYNAGSVTMMKAVGIAAGERYRRAADVDGPDVAASRLDRLFKSVVGDLIGGHATVVELPWYLAELSAHG